MMLRFVKIGRVHSGSSDTVWFMKKHGVAGSMPAMWAGVAADAFFRDPPTNFHPVAWFGRYAGAVEKKMYAPSKVRGAVFVGAVCAPVVAGAVIAHRKFPRTSLALALYASSGGATLRRVGRDMHAALDAEDLDAARALVPWLCSRDPELLDYPGVVRATVESLAENTSDAIIAPLFFSIFGAPGVVTHRLVNTLDAMVGYKNERYQEFGWAAAKLDDVLAYIPARLTTIIHVGVGVANKTRLSEFARALRTQAHRHPSPNAGPVETSAAVALGVRLGGPTQYYHGLENRPELGFGDHPELHHIKEAVRLSGTTQLSAAVIMSLVIRAISAMEPAAKD